MALSVVFLVAITLCELCVAALTSLKQLPECILKLYFYNYKESIPQLAIKKKQKNLDGPYANFGPCGYSLETKNHHSKYN